MDNKIAKQQLREYGFNVAEDDLDGPIGLFDCITGKFYTKNYEECFRNNRLAWEAAIILFDTLEEFIDNVIAPYQEDVTINSNEIFEALVANTTVPDTIKEKAPPIKDYLKEHDTYITFSEFLTEKEWPYNSKLTKQYWARFARIEVPECLKHPLPDI